MLQALVTAVLFTHVTCVPPPHVFEHSVQQVLPEIQNRDVICDFPVSQLSSLDLGLPCTFTTCLSYNILKKMPLGSRTIAGFHMKSLKFEVQNY